MDWFLIVIVTMQMGNGDTRNLVINEFPRPSQEKCIEESPVFQEHYETQLEKQLIDRIHMYGRTWYMHKKMLAGPVVGFSIKCEPRDRVESLDKPKVMPWIW